ncbi:MAG: hypothetical protein ACLTNW_17575 [Mediterraneibacter gnavus]
MKIPTQGSSNTANQTEAAFRKKQQTLRWKSAGHLQIELAEFDDEWNTKHLFMRRKKYDFEITPTGTFGME